MERQSTTRLEYVVYHTTTSTTVPQPYSEYCAHHSTVVLAMFMYHCINTLSTTVLYKYTYVVVSPHGEYIKTSKYAFYCMADADAGAIVPSLFT